HSRRKLNRVHSTKESVVYVLGRTVECVHRAYQQCAVGNEEVAPIHKGQRVYLPTIARLDEREDLSDGSAKIRPIDLLKENPGRIAPDGGRQRTFFITPFSSLLRPEAHH